MNCLTGIIAQISQSGAIMLVDLLVSEHPFSALLIESAQRPSWLNEGLQVEMVFKETEVSLAKNLSGLISLRNRMPCSVVAIEAGEILSTIVLDFKNRPIVAAITTRAAEALDLKEGDIVEAIVKANEISLMTKD